MSHAHDSNSPLDSDRDFSPSERFAASSEPNPSPNPPIGQSPSVDTDRHPCGDPLEELKWFRTHFPLLEQELEDSKILYETIVQHADMMEIELTRRCEELEARNRKINELNRKLESAHQELEHLVRTDPLTQIANRRYFDAVLEREWIRLGRDRRPLSLIMIDIDFFKLYNDSYGHQKGDWCLIEVSKAMLASVGRNDDVVARYGGEELAIVLPQTDAEGTIAVAQRCLSNLQDLAIPHRSSPVCDRVTISLGLATLIPDLNQPVDTLINHADTALYYTKSTMRNGYTTYSSLQDHSWPDRVPEQAPEKAPDRVRDKSSDSGTDRYSTSIPESP